MLPMTDTCRYALDTWTETRGPWATFTRARAICPDGKARVVKLALVADTYWTVPARVSYKGTTVAGFITFASEDGMSTNPEQWVKFIPTGKYADVFSS